MNFKQTIYLMAIITIICKYLHYNLTSLLDYVLCVVEIIIIVLL